MRKNLFAGAMLLLSVVSFGQMKVENSYTYSVSTPYKVIDAGTKIYFSKENITTAIKIDDNDIYIQQFDNLKPSFVKLNEYKKMLPTWGLIEGVVELKDKYVILYEDWDKKNKVEQLFAYEIDIKTGVLNTTPKLLLRIEGKVDRWYGKFPFYKTNDKSKLLFKYRRVPKEKRDKLSHDVLGFLLVDENLNQISSREVTMPYTERKTENLDYQLDNNGNLYMLEKVFEDDSNKDRKKKNEDPNYHLEIITLESKATEMKYTKLDLKDKFINKLWFVDSAVNTMEFGGLYNSGSKNLDDVDGIVTFSLNKDLAIQNKNFIEFPIEIINLYESEKSIKKNEKREAKEDEDGEGATVKNLELREMKVHQDGSKTIIGEEYFTVTHVHRTSNGTYTTTTYHYGDIYVSKVKADGKLAWMKKIPKIQTGSKGRGGMSYKYLYNDNKHFIVFLDNVKNLELPEAGKSPYRHSDGQGGFLTCVKIDDTNGNVTKGSILDVRGMEDFNLHQINMDRVFQTSENSFMMEAYKKKKEDVMLKINLN